MSEIRDRARIKGIDALEGWGYDISSSTRGRMFDEILSIPEIAIVDRDKQIKISISCGRSTDYVDEYWIEDAEGNVLRPWDFGSDRVGIWVKEIGND